MHESEDMYRGRNHSTQAATWSSVATWTAISSPRAQELFLNESDKVRGTPIMMFRALVSPFDLAAVAFALEVPHHPRVVSASCPKSIGSGVGALQSSPSPSLPLIIIIFPLLPLPPPLQCAPNQARSFEYFTSSSSDLVSAPPKSSLGSLKSRPNVFSTGWHVRPSSCSIASCPMKAPRIAHIFQSGWRVELSKSGSVKFRAKFAEPRTGPSVRF